MKKQDLPTNRVIPRMWLVEPLSTDVTRTIEKLQRIDDVQAIAILPDVHLCNVVSVGTVVGTRNSILPSAVGGDIGCGMLTIAFDIDANILQHERPAARLLADLEERVPWNRHLCESTPHALPSALASSSLSVPQLDRIVNREGRQQLGTLGRGNHFLEFQRGVNGQLWLMIHSGSRGMGQAISDWHQQKMNECNSRLSSRVDWLEASDNAGKAYLHDVAWARAYAAANRLAMADAVNGILEHRFGATTNCDSLIHTDHNHVQLESHGGQELWIHRKGAQSANSNEMGIVPGSMGTASFHVVGQGVAESLRSCSHGAGRRWHRSEARRRVSTKDLERQLKGVWYDHRLMRHLCEEAPNAYRNIRKVMQAQSELVRISQELQPLLSYKGV